MRTISTRFALLAALLLLVGCDTGGIHPLGRIRDVTGACSTPTSTWLRSTPEGTDVLLIGNTDPSDSVDVDEGRCFARGLVEHDSSTVFEVGTYELGSNGQGTVFYDYHYLFDYRPDQAILNRRGSRRTDYVPQVTYELGIVEDGATLLVTIGGETHRYTNMYAVIANLDPTTQAGAEDILRVYNLPLFTSQARLLGFGSAGMTMYVESPGTFNGLIQNSFRVNVEDYLEPTTHITYTNFEDLSGIVISGEQITYPNLAGDGTMSGALEFRMYGSKDVTDIVVLGTVDYGGLKIDNGVAAEGTYTLTIVGHGVYTLPYTLAADVDLRGVLPETTP